jgi:SNF2 family DNA or RNA helicase
LALIEAGRKNKDKTLVFCNSIPFMDVIEQLLYKRGFRKDVNVVRLQGSLTAKDKEKAKYAFQNRSNCTVFLASLRAACVGINLTKATRVILVDQSWNPATDLQVGAEIYIIYCF